MDKGKSLAVWRFGKALQCLKTAKMNIEIGDYNGASNRSYYCIFHSMRSVIGLKELDFKKHSAVISYFRQNYIKTKMFDGKLSEIINILFDIRNESDYGDYFVISKQDIIEQVENAEYFMLQIAEYLKGEGVVLNGV